MSDYRYFLIYKPFGIISQFNPEEGQKGLGELHDFPKDVYPVGRLDADSEGLLILTNDKQLNEKLLHPRYQHLRTYLIQVEGIVSNEAIRKLEEGVVIRIDGKQHHTAPADVKIIDNPEVPERIPPIRFRKSVPDSWIEMTLQEGKNRQVRRMTAAVGFPTLRLIRWRIENLEMSGAFPGMVIEIEKGELYKQLNIRPRYGNNSAERDFSKRKRSI